MDFLWDIILKASTILTPIFGIAGALFSLLLIISPAKAQSLSRASDRHVDIDDRITYIDKDLAVGGLSYTHNLGIGICLITGSFVFLLFSTFELDLALLSATLFGTTEHPLITDLILPTASWVIRIGCIFGILLGTCLIFAPDMLKRIEKKMNAWVETQVTISQLDKPSTDIDVYFFRHPVLFGVLFLFLSTVSIALSFFHLIFRG